MTILEEDLDWAERGLLPYRRRPPVILPSQSEVRIVVEHVRVELPRARVLRRVRPFRQRILEAVRDALPGRRRP